MTSAIVWFGLLACLSVSYTAAIAKFERLRLAVSSGTVGSLTSVWALAGCLILPPPLLVTLMLIIFAGAEWPTRRVVAKDHPWRLVYTAAAAILAALAAERAHAILGPPFGAVAAAGVFFSVNVGLVAAAMLRARQLQVLKVVLAPANVRLEMETLLLGAVLGAAANRHIEAAVLAVLPILYALGCRAYDRAVRESEACDPSTGLWREDIWRVQVDELTRRRSRVVALIMTCPEAPGSDLLIIDVLRGCIGQSAPLGRYGIQSVVAAITVRSAASGHWITQGIRQRLDEAGLAGTVGCGAAAGGDVCELLVSAMSDVMGRRSEDDGASVADRG